MGLFSSKTKVVVSSSVYNLAGEEENHPDYLKSTMFSIQMADKEDASIGSELSAAYRNGPRFKTLNFFNWAKRRDYFGIPASELLNTGSFDLEIVRPKITVPADKDLYLQTGEVTDGDFAVFARKWIIENRPDDLDTVWASDYDDNTHTISIQFENGDQQVIPAGIFSPNDVFVTVDYIFAETPSAGVPSTGDMISGYPSDLTGFLQKTQEDINTRTETLTETTEVKIEYSDGTPTQITTTPVSQNISVTRSLITYERKSIDTVNNQLQVTTETLLLWEDREITSSQDVDTLVENLPGGVTKTTTTTVTTQVLSPTFEYRIDTITQTSVYGVGGGLNMFLYRIGDGDPDLDALVSALDRNQEFIPFIPLRINNKMITDDDFTDDEVEEEASKAYKKLTGEPIEKIIELLEDNDDLAQIDYAYIMYGVPLNTSNKYSQRYIFEFFRSLANEQQTSAGDMDHFKATIQNHNSAGSAVQQWLNDPANYNSEGDFEPKSPRPTNSSYVQVPPTTTLKIKTAEGSGYFDNRVSWLNATETTHAGVGWSGAKKGEFHARKAPNLTWTTSYNRENAAGDDHTTIYTTHEIEGMELLWQVEDGQHRKMTVYGLIHRNYVYQGKYTEVTSHAALDDEDPSGFIIPLHGPTLRDIGTVASTQVCTISGHIVFNSYEVYKQKWYQRGIFRIFLVIAVVVISVLVNPAAVGAASGLLGVNAAVGVSLGLSGTAAILAGAVANALAGIIFSTIVSQTAVDILGQELGTLVAVFASFAVTSGAFSGFGSPLDWSVLTTPQGIMQLTSAVANGYQGFVAANIADIQATMFAETEEYETKVDEISDLMNELMGNNDLSFNPLELTDVGIRNERGYLPETADEFVHRTTLTGSDITDLTLNMVYDFPKLSLTLPKN